MKIFTNARLLTMIDDNIYENMQIEVDGDIISYIGCPRSTDGEVIDCGNALIMPSFVNAHAHGPMVEFLGQGEGLPLDRWLKEVIFPLEANWNNQSIYNAQKKAVDLYFANGITTVNEMYFYPKSIYDACTDMGIRAMVGVSADVNTTDRYALLDAQSKGIDRGHCVSYFHSIYACDENEIFDNIKWARDNQCLLHTHLAETLKEAGECDTLHKMTTVQYCESLGVFDVPTLLAHMVYAEKDDYNILNKYDVNVVSCPTSNSKLASGTPSIVGMMNAGINVCLGTDSVVSNGQLSIFREMFMTSNMQKVYYKDASVLTPFEILKMATINGAKALNIPQLGIIKEGYKADMIMIDINAEKFLNTVNILSALIDTADSSDIMMTICDGNIVYKRSGQ